MKPPARVVVGNLIWSTDGGVWALWRVAPFPHAYTAASEKLAVHHRLRALLIALPAESMLLSVCERIDAWDVVADMLDDVDVDRHPAWAEVCRATALRLSGADASLYRRLYYVAVELDRRQRGAWREALRWASEDVAAGFGLSPVAVPDHEIEARRTQARTFEARVGPHVGLTRATAGEIRWLYARALRRGPNEPVLDGGWEPPTRTIDGGRHNVLAPLSDAVVKEGGYRDDPDRPTHRRYVRIDSGGVTAYQTLLAMGDMPHEFTFPGGGGEWLHHADDVGFALDWCVRLRSVPNIESQAKVRRQHRQLIGQVDEYDGELTGAPPSLAEAIAAVDGERTKLAASPAEPELRATMIFSITASDLPELEDRANALTALFEPQEYGIFRPTGGQTALLRSMMPGTRAAAVCRDYTQFLLPGDLAAGAPFCGPQIGDPQGLLMGVSFDVGDGTPVLLDPSYGPRVGRTASLAAVGTLGSGKSFFLKRLCWDTIARGGQVVTVDRTTVGEYVSFARTVPGRVQVVRLAADADVCLDPLRTFTGDQRRTVTLGFLSLLAGCSAQSEEGAVLSEAVESVGDRPAARLGDVIDELRRTGNDPDRPDEAARSLARRLSQYRHLGVGRLAFGDGDSVSLDADFTVFWVPNLALPDRDTLVHEHLARQMLPEQILGHAVLYLVAAVGREVVFRDPARFGAALYDEAWALLASPHGERLLLEGVRDGRKHNGAIWLATQHPNDLGSGELVDLIGPRFVFRQDRGAIGPALRFLGADGSSEAADVLEHGLRTGQCLYRDVRDRIGLVQVLEPMLDGLGDAFDTTPAARQPGAPTAQTDAARSLRTDRSRREALLSLPDAESPHPNARGATPTHPNGPGAVPGHPNGRGDDRHDAEPWLVASDTARPPGPATEPQTHDDPPGAANDAGAANDGPPPPRPAVPEAGAGEAQHVDEQANGDPMEAPAGAAAPAGRPPAEVRTAAATARQRARRRRRTPLADALERRSG